MIEFVGPIKDVCLGIYDGPHATPKESDVGPVFLGIKNVTKDGRLDLSEIRHVSEQEFPQWTRRVVPRKDDIVFSYEATLHLYALIPEGFRGCLGRRMALVRPDTTKVVPRYLHYYFLSPAWKALMLSNVMTGATVDRIPIARFPSFEVRLPRLSAQQRIADTLSAYDDLIENNRRRIALLEQSARLLYREWFVHLRFPGHEHVKVVDGVPEGWAIFAVSEVADLYRGISYSSDQLVEEGGKPFVNLKCMNRFGGFRVSGVKRFLGEHKSQHVVKAGDIVVAVTDMTRDAMIVAQAAIVPKIVGDDAVFSMDMVKLVPKPAFASHWFHALLRFSSFSFEVREKANGATVLHLRPKHIEEWRTPIAPPALRDEYAEYVSPMYALMDELELQNEKLRQARDLLLPRLMSGDLAV